MRRMSGRTSESKKGKKKKRERESYHKPLKALHLFITSRLNGGGEQQSIITVSPRTSCKPVFPPPPGNTLLTNRSPGKFCFSKGHYLSSSEQLAGCMGTKFEGIISHIKQAWEVHFFPPSCIFFKTSFRFLFFLKDATVRCVWRPRGTLGHPLKKINIWTMLLWVSMYGCIKLNGPWNWFQVLLEKVYRYSEMKPGGEAPQRGADLHTGRFIIVFVSPN